MKVDELLPVEPGELSHVIDQGVTTLTQGHVATLIAVAVGVATVLVGLMLKVRRRSRQDESLRFGTSRAFGSMEGELWQRIQRAMPDHVVLMRVPLARFVVQWGPDGRRRPGEGLADMTVDFAVFRKDGTLCCVVLLKGEDGLAADAGRDWVLDSARVRIARWNVAALPSVDSIARALDPDPEEALVPAEPARASRRRGRTPTASRRRAHAVPV